MRLPALLVLGALLAPPAAALAAKRCVPCAFGGLCRTATGLAPCVPSEGECSPRRGILAFNSESPPTYAYWTVFGERYPGARGRIRGRLTVHVDAGSPTPAVPGFPGYCEGEVCFGDEARIAGRIVHDRLMATARYRDGATCYFDLSIVFGFGDPAGPNTFVCRTPGGDVLSQGPLRLQVIRLFGCESRRR